MYSRSVASALHRIGLGRRTGIKPPNRMSQLHRAPLPAQTGAAADGPDCNNSSLQRPALLGNRLLSTFSTLSRRSFTTASFEADDERSLPGGEYRDDPDSTFEYSDNMSSPDGDDDGSTPAAARSLSYSGRDSRPTSPKEIKGWYAYAFAAETYVICGIGMNAIQSHIEINF